MSRALVCWIASMVLSCAWIWWANRHGVGAFERGWLAGCISGTLSTLGGFFLGKALRS